MADSHLLGADLDRGLGGDDRSGLWRFGLLHCRGDAAVDFFLHNEDARRQFWPLSDYVFRSPVSYWDPARYGQIVAPIEVALVLVLTLLLLWRQRRMWERGLILVAATIQILPIIVTGGFHGLHGVG